MPRKPRSDAVAAPAREKSSGADGKPAERKAGRGDGERKLGRPDAARKPRPESAGGENPWARAGKPRNDRNDRQAERAARPVKAAGENPWASAGKPVERRPAKPVEKAPVAAPAANADAPSGRQAQWGTLQIIIEALFPAGFDVKIEARPGPVITAENLKAKLLALKATVDPRSQRERMREIGRKGGLKKVPRWKLRRIARKGVRARLRKARERKKNRPDHARMVEAQPTRFPKPTTPRQTPRSSATDSNARSCPRGA